MGEEQSSRLREYTFVYGSDQAYLNETRVQFSLSCVCTLLPPEGEGIGFREILHSVCRGLTGIQGVMKHHAPQNCFFLEELLFHDISFYLFPKRHRVLHVVALNKCLRNGIFTLNARQSENRAKGAVSPSEHLPPSSVSFFSSFDVSVSLIPMKSALSPVLSLETSCSSATCFLMVNQHTPPTPDGSLPLPQLGKNLQTYFRRSRLGHGWTHPRVEALYEHQKRPKQPK